MYGNDPDDNWSRLLAKLRDRRQQLVDDVIGGGLDEKPYAACCGRIQQIDEMIEMAHQVRRGEDRPAPRPRMLSVEE